MHFLGCTISSIQMGIRFYSAYWNLLYTDFHQSCEIFAKAIWKTLCINCANILIRYSRRLKYEKGKGSKHHETSKLTKLIYQTHNRRHVITYKSIFNFQQHFYFKQIATKVLSRRYYQRSWVYLCYWQMSSLWLESVLISD